MGAIGVATLMSTMRVLSPGVATILCGLNRAPSWAHGVIAVWLALPSFQTGSECTANAAMWQSIHVAQTAVLNPSPPRPPVIAYSPRANAGSRFNDDVHDRSRAP